MIPPKYYDQPARVWSVRRERQSRSGLVSGLTQNVLYRISRRASTPARASARNLICSEPVQDESAARPVPKRRSSKRYSLISLHFEILFLGVYAGRGRRIDVAKLGVAHGRSAGCHALKQPKHHRRQPRAHKCQQRDHHQQEDQPGPEFTPQSAALPREAARGRCSQRA